MGEMGGWYLFCNRWIIVAEEEAVGVGKKRGKMAILAEMRNLN